ncbi:MAG TPA: polysaccharide biosynthesis tyrosine autokinase [Acetobacteraceae bacterium]|nr:polysaccharide biosynthesis tyrosine autokinase [Acetobacteraceae bacterium]
MLPHSDPILEDPESQGVSFVAVLGALRRRKKLIVVTFFISMAVVVGTLSALPRRYTATASLEVGLGNTQILGGNAAANAMPGWMPGDNSIMATQIAVLKTRALAAQVLKELNLGDDPEFHSTARIFKDKIVSLAQQWLPSAWQDLVPWEAGADPQRRREEVVDHFLRQLSVEQNGTSHVISVSFTSADPSKAAEITNALGKQYLDNQVEAKYRATERTYNWAIAQLSEQRQQLLKAENAVVDYMAAHGLEAANGLQDPAQPPPYKTNLGGLPGQQLTSLQDDLVAARGRLAATQAKLHEIEAMAANGNGYDSLPEVASSPTIINLKDLDAKLRVAEAQLSSTYNLNAPVLDRIKAQRNSIARQIAAETRTIVQNIRNEEALERGRVAQFERLMTRGQVQYAMSERASVGLRELTRDANAKRAVFEKLLSKKNEIGEQLALIQPYATIISPAVVPTRPSFPNKLMIGGGGLIGALAVSFMLAALTEYSDRSLRTARQVERALGIINLGLVPLLRGRDCPKGQQPYSTVLHRPLSIYSESIRSVLLQLIDREPRQTQVILVTSALPGEGKTTMTMSLAAAAVRLGRRTVVVDLDLRYPSVARQAGLSPKADLLKYMDGSADLDQIIYNDPRDARLHLIPSRSSAGRETDTLHTSNLKGLIDKLRGRYECIFLDLPPSLALSDIQAVGLLADEVLLVVQWGKTSRSAVAGAVTAMTRIGITVAGVVLTQVDLAGHAAYGYEQIGEYGEKYLEYFQRLEGNT